MRRARASADDHARRHGWSRRRLPAVGGRHGRRAACPGDAPPPTALAHSALERGGLLPRRRRRRPPTSTRRTPLVHGTAEAPGVVDVQTHFLEFGPWGEGFPQASCGEADPADCFSVEYWYDLVLGGSDTSVAVISAVPVVGDADPLSVEAMERGRELATRLCGDGRVLIQGHAVPDVGPIDAAVAGDGRRRRRPRAVRLEGVHALAERLVPRRPRPGAAARSAPPSSRRSATPASASSPCTRGSPAATRTRRRSTSARRPRPTPTSRFLVYHSGFETGTPKGPTTPTAPASTGSSAASPSRDRPGRQRLRRARLDVADRDGRSRRGRPRARQAARGVRARAHPVGHRLDLVRVAAGPDRRLPGLRDHAGVPGAVRLPGADRRRQAADPVGQRRRAVRHRPCPRRSVRRRRVSRCASREPHVRPGRPARRGRRRSCASTPGSPPRRGGSSAQAGGVGCGRR